MDRHWFFTWRTFGTWLTGQAGFVGNYINTIGERTTDNVLNELAGPSMPALATWAADQLHDTAVSLVL
jgi:hypothetical protein